MGWGKFAHALMGTFVHVFLRYYDYLLTVPSVSRSTNLFLIELEIRLKKQMYCVSRDRLGDTRI